MAPTPIPDAEPSHANGLNGRITLEVGVRFSESGRVWKANPDDSAHPLQGLLPMALEGGGELVARYPGDRHWQLLTFRSS